MPKDSAAACYVKYDLTIHSRGTAIVPMSVPLTQALGRKLFFCKIAFVSQRLLRFAQRPGYLASHASSPAAPHIIATGSTGPVTWLGRHLQLVSRVTRLASLGCRVRLLRFHSRSRSGMVSLTIRSSGTATVCHFLFGLPGGRPLTQALDL